MRFVFLSARGDVVGGQGIHVRDISERLIREGHDVQVVLGAGKDVPEIFAEREIPVIQIACLRRDPSVFGDLRAVVALHRILRRFRPQIVSTHTSKAGAVGRLAAAPLRIPVLYTPHCWSFVDHFPKAGFYRRVERCLAPLTKRFIAVSEFERQLGLRARVCHEDNCLTIHNGMPDKADTYRARPGDAPPHMVSIARFDEQKDHRTLIAALAGLKELDWRLTLVGMGHLRPSVETWMAEAGIAERVRIIHYSDAVHELLANAQVFVLATLWESFPRSILEAMRAGLPVVASDVGGCAESVAHGTTGFIVPPKDVDALRGRLRELLADPAKRETMGAASRARYEAMFTFEHMFQKHLALYESIVRPG